jgi:hypothetical protein
MSDGENKALPPIPDPAPEPVGSGKPRRTERDQKDLDRTMRQIAARLRRDFAPQIFEDPRKFKKRAVHYLRRSLPPFPGRPREASLTKAIELHKAGLEWKAIYPQCIPDHSQMPPAVRRQTESNLRAACRSRRNAAKRRISRRVEPIQQTWLILSVLPVVPEARGGSKAGVRQPFQSGPPRRCVPTPLRASRLRRTRTTSICGQLFDSSVRRSMTA